jgi:nuclear receptor subfamily 6 group A
MVLAAVREDRMPGGRNSGAVYNLYKVKYRKHKKPANGTLTTTTTNAVNSNHVINTTATTTTTTGILKSALTCPRSESFVNSRVAYNSSAVTSATTNSTTAMTTSSPVSTTSSIMPFFKALMTRDPVMSREESDQLLNALIECDDFQDFGFVFKILIIIFLLFTV